MKTFSLATLFLPTWALPWVAVVGVLAWIVGARALAVASGLLLAAEFVVAPLLEPCLATLPTWSLMLIGVVMALTVAHGIIDFLFGKETASHVTGTYLVRLLDFLMFGPFRMLGRFLRRGS